MGEFMRPGEEEVRQQGIPQEVPLEGLPQHQMVQGEYTPDNDLSRAELLDQKTATEKTAEGVASSDAKLARVEKNVEDLTETVKGQERR